MSELADAPIVT